MTLAAPRSRQGKLTLVLAILAVAVAAVGVFLWSSRAEADITTTTVTLASNQGATANPGDTITYTATVTQVGVPGGNTANTTFAVTLDAANLANVTATGASGPWSVGECSYAAPVFSCVDAAGPVASATITFTADVVGGGDNTVDPPTNCSVTDDGTGEAICTSNIAALPVNGVTCTGGGSYLIGTDVVVTCTVPIGLTYCSDNNTLPARIFDANATTGDMTVSPAAAVVSGPTAGLAAATATDTASVTVSSATAQTVTVSLSTHLSSSDNGPDDCTAVDTEVTFTTLAGLGGDAFLRHVDVDCGTERDFNSGGDDYDGNTLPCNGLLSDADISSGVNALCQNDVPNCWAIDDPDDAIGSEHTVCIIGGDLTDANLADITFTVSPNAPNQDPLNVNNNKHGVDVNGDGTLEPCVSWRVGNVGVQQSIAAVYDPTGELIYSNGVRVVGGPNGGNCPDNEPDGAIYGPCQVLIKEWNSIDYTKIVQNSGDRDGNLCTGNSGSTCANANLDGETINVNGVTNFDGFVDPSGSDSVSLVEYVIGSHFGYDGPIDGAEQTFSVSGDCGFVNVEDPLDANNSFDLSPNESVTLPTNSDKGVGFTIFPVSEETDQFNCVDGECLTVAISTVESSSFLSADPDDAADESITVCWHAGPGPEKQPMLAWVGQRVVLSHDWSDPADGSCPWYPGPRGDTGPFYVRYLIQTPSPGALSNVPNDAPALVTGPDYIVVPVEDADNCISHVIYESQNQGRVDVTAHVVEPPISQPAADFSVISPEYDFWYYYMKIEDVTLKIVPGSRSDHNSGSFSPQNPSPANDVDAVTENVSADELLRVTVRGWVLADNCPVKDAGQDINGLLLPANRCTFPTDWAQVVGDDAQFDILGQNPGSCSVVAGPFSLLNGLPPQVCDNDSKAPLVGGGFRKSVFSNNSVGTEDAPMPPALITLNLEGSGFLHGADKDQVYSQANQYFITHIPAEPQILVTGSGYQWHTWNGSGARSGPYDFWDDLAGTGNPIVSCPGDSPCSDGVPTGGYDMIQIYSDNHGEAMAWVNGDANLTFDDCAKNTPVPAHGIVQLNGYYCELNDVVGSTTITANADYPDKKPHQDVDADDDVTITWTWGGIKTVTVEPGETPQFNYVVFHVTDRDGFCDSKTSLHPVLGETVNFLIDSPTGVIAPNVNGDSAEANAVISANLKAASTVTFPANTNDAIDDGGTTVTPLVDDNECQAWIHVSESQLSNVNVVITAFDPEGTVTFDTRDINPPTPTPSPSPTEPPFTITVAWGNTDCSVDGIRSRDSQAILKRVLEQPELSQDQPCPSIGQQVVIDGTTYQWGNFDCSADGIRARDSQAILKNVLQQTAVSQTEPCPDIGSQVQVQPISIP